MTAYRCAKCGSFGVAAHRTADASARYAVGTCSNCGPRATLTTGPVPDSGRRRDASDTLPAFPGASFSGSLSHRGWER